MNASMQTIIITIGYGCKPISNRRPWPLKILIFFKNSGEEFPNRSSQKRELIQWTEMNPLNGLNMELVLSRLYP